MVVVFWSVIAVLLLAAVAWTIISRRRLIASVEAASLAPDGSTTEGRGRSSYEIESRGHMGAGQGMFGPGSGT